jgi:hypothetical protein
MVYVCDLGPGGTHLLQSKNKEQLFYKFKTCWSRTHVGWHVDDILSLNSETDNIVSMSLKILGISFMSAR